MLIECNQLPLELPPSKSKNNERSNVQPSTMKAQMKRVPVEVASSTDSDEEIETWHKVQYLRNFAAWQDNPTGLKEDMQRAEPQSDPV